MKVVVAEPYLLPHRDLLISKAPPGTEFSWSEQDLSGVEVYIGSVFTAEMAASADRLRLVQVAGAGTNGVDFSALPADALCANTFHHGASIGEYVVAALILLARRIPEQDRALRDGRWLSPKLPGGLPQPSTLDGRTVGFVGFGHIGVSAWRFLRELGMRAVAVTGSGKADPVAYGLDWLGATDRLTDLLAESDAVVVSAPLNEQTTGMIGAAELAAMKPSAILVNVGRGPLIDERALYEALRDDVIAGAAIDVWYRYPGVDGQAKPSVFPFQDLGNVLMTPHVSGVTSDTFRARIGDIAENLRRLSQGEALLNVVSP
ncbi:2-hydroxyacid dehydrogenase [Fodinicola acaciae]|uniref:2-hydroxyacid dehydrogenase n=1 Tax=Fodinicola acaciae TaxID=2681555 RepID=UPI0013D16471|nr:2-hydroxyacid dehydrogenase [Fodinicola acaciae]